VKKIITFALLAALLLSLFAGCGKNDFLTAEQAQKVALKDLGIKASQAESIHTHVGSDENGAPAYSIHITVDGEGYEYLIRAADGEILAVKKGDIQH